MPPPPRSTLFPYTTLFRSRDFLVLLGFPLEIPEHGAAERADRGERGGLDLLRSEEHTSELQSQSNLVCRLLLEKKKYFEAYEKAGGTAVDQQAVQYWEILG